MKKEQIRRRSSRRIGCRKRGHDYRAPSKYHITIHKVQDCINFSEIIIKELTPEGVILKLSLLGQVIWRQIRAMQTPYFRVYQYKIMPDHIHLLIHVKKYLPMHLSHYIARFKTLIMQEWRQKISKSEIKIFEEGYHDRIVMPGQSLDVVFRYIRQNPYRLAVRRARPEFFRKERNIFIEGREIQAYGNLFYLRNPFKYALIVHRADDERIFTQKLQECLYYAHNGGIVVSAFISAREKEIRKAIEEEEGRIILIGDRPFDERAKPARHDFELCSEGRLLIISPIDYLALPKSEHPSRSQCLNMNAFAEKLARNPEIR